MLFTGMLTEILTRSGNTSGLHSCHSWHALPGHAASTGRHVSSLYTAATAVMHYQDMLPAQGDM